MVLELGSSRKLLHSCVWSPSWEDSNNQDSLSISLPKMVVSPHGLSVKLAEDQGELSAACLGPMPILESIIVARGRPTLIG